MIKFKKHLINIPDYTISTLPGKEISGVTFYVDGGNDHFELKVVQHNTDNTDSVILWNKVLADNIKQYGNGADFVAYGIVESQPMVCDLNGDPSEPYIIKPSEFNDIFSDTLASRSHPRTNNQYNNYPYYIFVDDQNSDFSTWTVVLKVPETANYTFGGSLKTVAESAQSISRYAENLPSITLSSSSATMQPNSSINITINTDPSVKEVFIDTVYGLTNKQRVTLTNGTGTLTAYSTDLQSGENVRIRAGYRRVPSITDIVIPVV